MPKWIGAAVSVGPVTGPRGRGPQRLGNALALLAAVTLASCTEQPSARDVEAPSYWIWAGRLPDEAPADARELWIHQGRFVQVGGSWDLEHQGLYPSPLARRRIQLVFRLHELPPPAFVAETLDAYSVAWGRHAVEVTGVQLDFDSPSASLADYGAFLGAVREQLPDGVGLSITGLATWLADAEPATRRALHRSVDHVAYQLYAGRRPHADAERFLRFLSRLPHPFEVGLLDRRHAPAAVARLRRNPAFRGTVVFLGP